MCKVTTEEVLYSMVDQHSLWLKSPSGSAEKQLRLEKGQLTVYAGTICLSRADLRGAILTDLDLGRIDLSFADLSGTDMRGTNLTRANLIQANLSTAHLGRANLTEANLTKANFASSSLCGANLLGATLQDTNLYGANLSGAKGLLDPYQYLHDHFEQTKKGIIVYKQFDLHYKEPKYWTIEEGAVIEEVVNPRRDLECGCGINVGTARWIEVHGGDRRKTWRCLITWERMSGVAVPYATRGKIRTAWLQLLEPDNN